MPRKSKELSALDVKRLTRPGAHAVGGVAGLQLDVKDTGARSWVLRWSHGGRRRRMGLGSYPDVTLSQARDRAREAHDAIRSGVDPIAERRATEATMARSITFAKAVARYHETKAAEFSSDKHSKLWLSALQQHAIPKLGKLTVDVINVQDVLGVLSPIWVDMHPTAKKLRQRIEAVLAWATVHGYRTGDNPARLKGNLDAILPKPNAVATVKHHPAVPVDQVARWFADLRKREGQAARVLEFIALTAARSGEVRGATWSEVDLKARTWTIPAARMKANRDHVVTLSRQAVELLMAQPRDGELIFPAPRGGQLTDAAVSKLMRGLCEDRYLDSRSGSPAVVHGLRSTFRDWADVHTDFPPDMAEFALAHVVGSDVVRAYRRQTMVEKRRVMMQEWAECLNA